jgi:hypothetical protein
MSDIFSPLMARSSIFCFKFVQSPKDAHWREIYSSRPYVEKGTTYADYQTAYRTGYEGYDRYGHSGRSYSDIEVDLRIDYESDQSGSLPWEKAKHAVRDAWERASDSFRN